MLVCYNLLTGSGCRVSNPDEVETCQNCGRHLRHSLHLHDPGSVINGYRIVKALGYGGFGAVYEAENEQSRQRVALKETFDPQHVEHFKGEFEILERLNHPHLPRYYQVFEAQDHGYLVMELVPGQSLAEILKKQNGPLIEAQVLGYAIQLCDTLTYLHTQSQPVLHRDIKPDNIRLTPEGLIKLVDFGLLKQGSDRTQSARAGMTPAYAPVEQHLGDRTEPRSDIYSLGATLYHLLTGQIPLSAFDRMIAEADALKSPLKHNPNISPHVAEAIMMSLSLRPEERYPNAATFKQALVVGKASAPPVQVKPQSILSRPKTTASPTTSRPTTTLAIKSRLALTIKKHAGAVWSMAFSPNGQLLASSSWDNTIRLWDVSSGREVKLLARFAYPVYGVAYSPDGLRLASSSVDNLVRLWDAASGREMRQFRGHSNVPVTLAFSPDGQILASGSLDASIRLWEVATGKALHRLEGHLAAVHSIAFTANGRTLASSSKDGTIRLWAVPTGREVRQIEEHNDDVYAVAFTPDGRTLVSGGKNGIVGQWGLSGPGWQREVKNASAVHSLAFNPSGEALALGSADGTLYLWQADSGREVWRLKGHGDTVSCVAFSPNGRILASGSLDNTIRLWHIEDV